MQLHMACQIIQQTTERTETESLPTASSALFVLTSHQPDISWLVSFSYPADSIKQNPHNVELTSTTSRLVVRDQQPQTQSSRVFLSLSLCQM